MNESEEIDLIIASCFFKSIVEEHPVVDPACLDKTQLSLIRELEQLIEEYAFLELDIDCTPYKKAVEKLKNIEGKIQYQQFLDELLLPYKELHHL